MHALVVVIVVLFCSSLASALNNVASRKAYSVDPVGFDEVVFKSHNNQGYSHVTSSAAYLHDGRYLTDDVSRVSIDSVLWKGGAVDPFNVTVTIDLETAYAVQEVFVAGLCCNLGIYTPTAGYAYGSNTSDPGSWTLLGKSDELVSGDNIDTPAIKYEMHFVTTLSNASFRYIQFIATGAADKYMSIRTIFVYA